MILQSVLETVLTSLNKAIPSLYVSLLRKNVTSSSEALRKRITFDDGICLFEKRKCLEKHRSTHRKITSRTDKDEILGVRKFSWF